ncbi:MAG: hypothetical protein SOW55_07215 [Bacilli bacterium]|nr:hypothetical protein [Bacilli bacterium]
MNSKDALKCLCNHCEKLSIRDGFIGCPFRNISNDYCEEFEIIKKELEILEMLKNYIDFYTYRDTDSDSCINIAIHESVKIYPIIKELLEK